MAKNKTNEKMVTDDMLDGFKKGDKISRYCFYSNLTFEKIENGNVYLSDINGDIRYYPRWIFLKHARVV